MPTSVEKRIALYLLPFMGGTHFKFGIANGRSRIMEVNKAWKDTLGEIDETRSLVVTAMKNNTIRIIEGQLKVDYGHLTIANATKTGFTEILPIAYWQNVLADVASWQEKPARQVNISKMYDTPYRISLPRRVNPKTRLTKRTNLEQSAQKGNDQYLDRRGIFVLMDDIGLSMIKQAYTENKKSFTFSEKEEPGALSFCRWAMATCRVKSREGFYGYFSELLYDGNKVTLNSTDRFLEDLISGKFFKLIDDASIQHQLIHKFFLKKGEVDDEVFYHKLKEGVITDHIYSKELDNHQVIERLNRMMSVQSVLEDKSLTFEHA